MEYQIVTALGTLRAHGGAMIVSAVVVLVIAGLILWAVSQFPLDATIVRLIRVVVVVACVLMLLRVFGLWHGGLP